MALRQRFQHRAGAVARAVVDGDHLEVWIALSQRGQQRLFAALLFVVAGHQDRDERRAGHLRRLALLAPLPFAFPMQPEVHAAGHPQAGHEQRIEEHEGQQQVAGGKRGQRERQRQREAQDDQGKQSFDHGAGYQALDSAGRITSSRGWLFRKSSG
ncbi:hypothetical protein D3C81_1501550 [compost metagenome]